MWEKLNDPRWEKVAHVYDAFINSLPNARIVIAGGAIRDTLNNKPIKDFDIYITGVKFVEARQPIITVPVSNITLHIAADNYYPDDDFVVYNVDNSDIRVIVTRLTVEELMDDFDINICKCYYETGKGIVTNKEYEEGIAHKTIQQSIELKLQPVLSASVPKYDDHLKRVAAKYPDFKSFVKYRT